MDLLLAGKVAMVAGASRGLGKAVAAALAEEGAQLSICARTSDALKRTAESIEQQHAVSVLAQPVDVTSDSEVASWVDATRERFGHVDVLVTNAGGPPASRFDTTELADWKTGIELNLLSTIHLCRAVVPLMRERKAGRIVAITSISVKQPVDGLILSNVTRLGVVGLFKTLANELAPEGIGVNVVCPGYTRTDRLEELAARMSKQRNVTEAAIYDDWTAEIPMKRLGEPEEFAAVVAFLCSQRASYVTGTCLQIDGGAVKGIL